MDSSAADGPGARVKAKPGGELQMHGNGTLARPGRVAGGLAVRDDPGPPGARGMHRPEVPRQANHAVLTPQEMIFRCSIWFP
jgi:hypothetical protein